MTQVYKGGLYYTKVRMRILVIIYFCKVLLLESWLKKLLPLTVVFCWGYEEFSPDLKSLITAAGFTDRRRSLFLHQSLSFKIGKFTDINIPSVQQLSYPIVSKFRSK